MRKVDGTQQPNNPAGRLRRRRLLSVEERRQKISDSAQDPGGDLILLRKGYMPISLAALGRRSDQQTPRTIAPVAHPRIEPGRIGFPPGEQDLKLPPGETANLP